MPTKPVIINNSPLVFLWILNLLPLLRELYTDVWIPEDVQEEFLRTETMARRSSLDNAPWIRTVSLADPQSASVYGRLDQGEASVLALAKEHDAHLVIIDEKKAREEAKRIGLPVRGTVGVLLEAKKKGLIDAIKPLLETLHDNGMYLEQSFIDDVLQLAEETY
jgi:predicted nucleic acid-binding protein